MDEIKVYYNTELSNEIISNVEFEPLPAGKITLKSLYFQNTTEFPINTHIKLIGEDIRVKSDIAILEAGEVKPYVIEIKPKVTSLKPIQARLEVQIDYIVI